MAVKSYGPKVTGVGVSAGGSVNVTDGAVGNSIYVGTTAPSSPSVGDIWIDNATGATAYLARWKYTSTGGETTLSGSDDSSVTLSYVPGNEIVSINGVEIVRGVDYTATSGTSIVLSSALIVGDTVSVISFLNVNTNAAILSTNFTASGQLLVGSGNGTYNVTSIDQNAFAFQLMTMGA